MELVSIKKIPVSLYISKYHFVFFCYATALYLQKNPSLLSRYFKKYFLPHSFISPFLSKLFTRMHCISSHGLEKGSRQWHLLNMHFSSPELCSEMKEVSIPSEGEQHWDWLLAAGSQDADTQSWEMSREQLCKPYSFSWNVNPAPLRGLEKLLWSRQDKVCRAPGGFMLQEAEGHEKEDLSEENSKREGWHGLTVRKHHPPAITWHLGPFPYQQQLSESKWLLAPLGWWENGRGSVEMLTTQRDAKMHGPHLKASTKPLPPGKPLFCSSKCLFSLLSIKPCVCCQGLCRAQLSWMSWEQLGIYRLRKLVLQKI